MLQLVRASRVHPEPAFNQLPRCPVDFSAFAVADIQTRPDRHCSLAAPAHWPDSRAGLSPGGTCFILSMQGPYCRLSSQITRGMTLIFLHGVRALGKFQHRVEGEPFRDRI